MKSFTSISIRLALMAFAGVALMQTPVHSSSLDERFKTAINKEIVQVKNTENPAEKREMLGKFLKHMDAGIGLAKTVMSEKDARSLDELQLKINVDYAELNGTTFGGTQFAKVSDSDLNLFAGYVQQDAEQADGVIYISAGGLIIVLIILLIIL